MADEVRLGHLLEELNDGLGAYTPYKLALLPPAAIQAAPKNARYMTKRQHDQLVTNIRHDGNLSSLPFCWRDDDGAFSCISGHHRVQAAQAAGVEKLLVLYTDRNLSQSERIAMQLSHNAIVGQDDPGVLRSLWDSIDSIDWKFYSGLDDKLLATIDSVTVARVGEAKLEFEELRILFVAPEIDRLKDLVQLIGASKRPVFLADKADFDRFFEALIQFKEQGQVLSTATAMMMLCEMAERYVAESEKSEHEETKHDDVP